jgi:hypothetical protein
MHGRWSIAVAMLAILGAARLQLGAQGRISIGGPGRLVVSQPGPRAPLPSIHGPIRPIGPIGMVPAWRVAREHRPLLKRSSVLGLVAFDPYWWLSPVVDEYVVPPEAALESRPSGGLQLDVEPRRALVYVDGVLVGNVDQFKGYFKHLETSAGFHVIDFLAADYDPLTIGVTVAPNKTTTYRGFLNRANGR